MSEEKQKRYTLTQEEMAHRRRLDTKFEKFMQESLDDRRNLRATLEDNTATLNQMRIALFAKDEDNDLGIPGLVPSMQRVLQHVSVTCSIAKFLKWFVLGMGALAGAVLTMYQLASVGVV